MAILGHASCAEGRNEGEFRAFTAGQSHPRPWRPIGRRRVSREAAKNPAKPTPCVSKPA